MRRSLWVAGPLLHPFPGVHLGMPHPGWPLGSFSPVLPEGDCPMGPPPRVQLGRDGAIVLVPCPELDSDTTTGSRAQGLVERAVGETSKQETRVLWVRPLLAFWVPFGEQTPRARGRSWSPCQLFPQTPICRQAEVRARGLRGPASRRIGSSSLGLQESYMFQERKHGGTSSGADGEREGRGPGLLRLPR